jgi:FtsP/CotA-like multicopper oxidase with cupredoxin domain
MNMITRRQFLASSAACGFASAVTPLIASAAAQAASPVLLRAESRVIEIGGRAAKVYGLVREGGQQGLALQAGQDFRVRLENALDAPTLIHWHGLTPPFGQDGVPDLPQPLLKPGESFDYAFPLDTPGTHWMHAHTLQEQQLLAAPLIVADPGDASADEQEVVVLLHDFSFKSPEELLTGLTGGSMPGHGMPGMGVHGASGGGHGGHGSGGVAMDINDIEYDAYLASDRTLDDPEVFRVERGGALRLRIINGATATAFWIDTGMLEGEAIAVDGNAIVPVPGRRFPLGMGQRIDIRLRLPSEEGAWPVLALREGAVQRTGFVLATAGGQVRRTAPAGDMAAAPLDLAFEAYLGTPKPLPDKPAHRTHPVLLGGTMEGYVWTINGKLWGEHRPLPVQTGERVELVMRNDSMMGHPMHLHGHHFQVVAINGRRIQGARRDTVWLPPQSEVTVAFDASNPGTWAFHCHHLYHMATGMMTVVEYVG